MIDDSSYNASNISVLEGLDPVKKRPEMYIGSTDKAGFHHLAWEIIDNSVDEALAGYCTKIRVTINKDGSLSVSDNGRGVPVDIHAEKGISAATLVYTVLHAGGKFGGGGYAASGGLHGVGSSVVNALSSQLELKIARNGEVYKQSFEKGIPVTDMVTTGDKTKATGTQVRFTPDKAIFIDAYEDETFSGFDFDTIAKRLKKTSYLTRGLEIILIEGDRTETFISENGLMDMLEEQSPESAQIVAPFMSVGDEEGVHIELAFCYDKGFNRQVSSYVNNIETYQGGSHEQGFIRALSNSVNTYGTNEGLLKKPVSANDISEGLTAAISIRIEDPKFEGQTKHKLNSSLAARSLYAFSKVVIDRYLEENPVMAKKIVKKAVSAQLAREAAQKSREKVRRVEAMSSLGTLPGKLADCQIRERDGTELFIVEGDSAGGSAKQGRDRKFQAILPLRGKILNALKESKSRQDGSEQITNLMSALGCGTDSNYDEEKLRYGKIIIMTDADVDGSHISVLALTYFMQRNRQLIRDGRVYLAVPPLHIAKKANDTRYFIDDDALFAFQADLPPGNWEFGRFKGLGEMNPEELWSTTMDPQTRILQQVILLDEDEEDAESTFTMLMGESVAERREFIELNANYSA